MKKILTTIFAVFMCMTMLTACGEQATNIVAQKAIEAYVDTFLGDMKSEDLKRVVSEQKEALAVKALHNFSNVPEIQDLPMQDRVKQSVLLAVEELSKSATPPAEG